MAYATDLFLISDKEKTQVLRKLHCQFGHASQDKLIGLLKDAQVWDSSYNKSLQEVIKQCEHCKCFSRTPPWSKVALPMAKCFNDVVCVDLKYWSKGHILHIIDMWSRYIVSVFVRSKQPKGQHFWSHGWSDVWQGGGGGGGRTERSGFHPWC